MTMWNRDSLLHLMAAGKAHNLRGAQSSQEVFLLALFKVPAIFLCSPAMKRPSSPERNAQASQ